MKISELQEKLFLIANTHGDLNIFISDPTEENYAPRPFEEITLRETDADLAGYPHVQLNINWPY